MSRPVWLLAPIVAWAIFGALPATASAGCTSSTEHSQSFPDGLGDDEGGLAPDISAVLMITTANCATSGTLSLADGRDSLIEGETVGMYYDIDGNTSTGYRTGFVGADRVVITIGHNGADSNPGVGVYNSSTDTMDFGSQATPVDVGVGGWTWGIDQIAFQPVTVGVSTIAMYEGSYDSYSDFSPQPGTAAHGYPVSYSTSASTGSTEPPPSQPAPTQPTQPAPTTTAPTTTAPAFVCKPGQLRGLKLSLARAKAVSRGCDVKVRFKRVKRGRTGRVLSATVNGETVTLKVSKRRVRARRSSVTARGASAPRMTAASINERFVAIATARQR